MIGSDQGENPVLFRAMLLATFAGVAEEEDLECFDSIREATGAIGDAFKSAQTILFFPAESVFGEVKGILCRALGLRVEADPALLAAAEAADPASAGSESFTLCHAGVPAGAVPFAHADGLYSGFGIRKKDQTVIVLPMHTSRTGVMLAKRAIPYLNAAYGTAIPIEPAAYVYAYALEQRLRGTGITIAVSDTKTTPLFCRYIENAGDLQKMMPVAAKAEQRGALPPDEYVVNLSITAAEFLRAPYGVAMTNAYYTGEDPTGERVVYIAVTSPRENTVREILSYYGESTADFLLRCCGEACALVEQIVDADGLLTEEDELPAETPEPHPGYRRYRTVFSVMLALLAVLFAFGVYYFTDNDYTLKDWADTYVPMVKSVLHLNGSETEPAQAANAEAKTGKTERVTAVPSTKKKEAATTRKAAETTTAREGSPTASPTVPAEDRVPMPTREQDDEDGNENEEENREEEENEDRSSGGDAGEENEEEEEGGNGENSEAENEDEEE